MTATERKRAERASRKQAGEVEFGCWLSASDHEALSAMAREAGMTQAQVVSALIQAVGAVRSAKKWSLGEKGGSLSMIHNHYGDYIRHSDLTAAVGLGK